MMLSILPSKVDSVDTSAQTDVGVLSMTNDGNIYCYMQGVASGVAYAAVTYDEDYVTSLSTANAVGPVAIMNAILDATTEFGWYLVRGEGTNNSAGAVADNKTLSLTSTAGKLDDADAAGDAIVGAWSRSAPSGAATMTVQLDFPKVHDIAID